MNTTAILLVKVSTLFMRISKRNFYVFLTRPYDSKNDILWQTSLHKSSICKDENAEIGYLCQQNSQREIVCLHNLLKYIYIYTYRYAMENKPRKFIWSSNYVNSISIRWLTIAIIKACCSLMIKCSSFTKQNKNIMISMLKKKVITFAFSCDYYTCNMTEGNICYNNLIHYILLLYFVTCLHTSVCSLSSCFSFYRESSSFVNLFHFLIEPIEKKAKERPPRSYTPSYSHIINNLLSFIFFFFFALSLKRHTMCMGNDWFVKASSLFYVTVCKN